MLFDTDLGVLPFVPITAADHAPVYADAAEKLPALLKVAIHYLAAQGKDAVGIYVDLSFDETLLALLSSSNERFRSEPDLLGVLVSPNVIDALLEGAAR
jgi:hypothetical protein